MSGESSDKVISANNKRFFKDDHILTVLICALTIPLSMSMWIINLVYTKLIASNDGFDEPVAISPARWLAACSLPLFITVHGYRKKKLDLSGAVSGFIVGFILTLSSFGFFATLCTFFLSGSRATKFREHIKKKIEGDFKEGGQRSWTQVLCNAGMATQLALLYLLDVGACERPVDFVKDYRASWLIIGVLAVMACCNGDTWSSELGTVLSTSDPYLVTTWKKVPRGTNGGVSFIGLVVAAAGGMLVGLSYYVTIWYFADKSVYMYAPPQWPIILYGALSGLLGSLADSIFGATLQYTGMDKNGKVVGHSNQTVKHVNGPNILDNHSVNLVSTVIIGILIPTISKNFWPSV